jgi:hypothetical protein
MNVVESDMNGSQLSLGECNPSAIWSVSGVVFASDKGGKNVAQVFLL